MLKKIVLGICFCATANAYAGLPEMMKIYNNPKSAPKVAVCKGNHHCNAFTALAAQWQDIPKNYRYHGFDIRKQAAKGDGYGLYKGFSLQADQSIEISDAGDRVYYDGLSKSKNESTFAKGRAVLLYIEDKNHWAYN